VVGFLATCYHLLHAHFFISEISAPVSGKGNLYLFYSPTQSFSPERLRHLAFTALASILLPARFNTVIIGLCTVSPHSTFQSGPGAVGLLLLGLDQDIYNLLFQAQCLKLQPKRPSSGAGRLLLALPLYIYIKYFDFLLCLMAYIHARTMHSDNSSLDIVFLIFACEFNVRRFLVYCPDFLVLIIGVLVSRMIRRPHRTNSPGTRRLT